MPNAIFAFKQFTIKQDRCAMKVGTDAVLLGAWVTPNNPKKILDIGTGTGVIALMLAQKSNADIFALEIDKSSFDQAELNIRESIFKDKITVLNKSFQEFSETAETKFDLIVTNPPYFVDSLKNSDSNRSGARHADTLPYKDLLIGVKKSLLPKGKFCLILPKKEAEKFRELAKENGLYLSKMLRVKTRLDKEEEKRQIMQFEFSPTEFSESTLVIEKNERMSYTEEYKELTKDYYLNF